MSSAGHYQILGVLGRGGFGAVYHARFHGRHGFVQDVALKVVLPGSADEELAVRLRDEARVLALLQHPGIVSVFRLSLLEQGWAVAMERVRGADLAQIIEARGPLPAGPALEIVAQVAGALRFAWSHPGPDSAPLRAVHRDIKPENLRLSEHGLVKVLDFGIAHAIFAARESQTARDRVPGTLKYMAPERFDGQQGPSGDVYALGCVLYALLAGEVLGAARGDEEAHDGWVRKRVGRLSEARPDLDQELLVLLYSLLRFQPEARPDAAALERSARGLLRGAPGAPLADLAPAWLAALGEAPPDTGDPAVGAVLRELSAPSVAQPEVLEQPETVFSPMPVPEPAGQARRAALVHASTDGDARPRRPPAAPRPWERITWGHVAAFIVLLGLGFGGAGAALRREEPAGPVASAPAEAATVAPEIAPIAPDEGLEAPDAPRQSATARQAPQPETVLVQVSGDAELVELVRGARRVRLPARVAPGPWSLAVRFPGAAASRDKGSVTVRAGLQIRCDAEFVTCDW